MTKNQHAFTLGNGRRWQWGLFLLLGFCLGATAWATLDQIVTISPVARAQTPVTGEWTAEVRRQGDDKIQLNLSRDANKGHQNFGSSYALAELPGLTREQTQSANTEVAFRLVREAGTVEFRGTFRAGRGAGQFKFLPSQDFIAAMRTRGYDQLSEEKLLSAAMLNVQTKAIDELKAAGYPNLMLEDVFKATIFQVTPDFINQMRGMGFANLELEELVKARIFKITPEFAGEMRSLGFDNLSMEELVKARIFKITPELARQVAELGFGRQEMETLVKMQIFKVTPEFVREIRALGLANLSIEDFVKFKIHKIDADFINRARAKGYAGSDPEELVRLRIHKGREL